MVEFYTIDMQNTKRSYFSTKKHLNTNKQALVLQYMRVFLEKILTKLLAETTSINWTSLIYFQQNLFFWKLMCKVKVKLRSDAAKPSYIAVKMCRYRGISITASVGAALLYARFPRP